MSRDALLENAMASIEKMAGRIDKRLFLERLIVAAWERGRWVECPAENCDNGTCPKGGNEGTTRWFCKTCHGKGKIRRELAGVLEVCIDTTDLQTWGYVEAAREKWGGAE